MTKEQAAIQYASRMARGLYDESGFDWLEKGFSSWLRSGGKIPLDRYLGLPTSESKLRLLQRNQWITVAAGCIKAASAPAAAGDLAIELDRFLSRGPWREWRQAADPPADASKLRCALFHIAKANDGKSLSAKQLHRILDTNKR